MSFEKQAQVQRTAIENAEELEFYVRDLKQWEMEIKKRDKDLLRQKGVQDQEVVGEPVRGTGKSRHNQNGEKKRKKKKCKKKTSDNEMVKCKIPSYDYASWDKFDVEKACEDVDNEAESEEEDDDTEEDEEQEVLRAKQQAVLEKDKGNAYLKAGKLDEAIDCYTRGRQLDPFNALLPANRALALLKKEQFGAAEADCDTTITLDPTYVKAFQRRAVARMALKKYSLARDDLLTVLRLEPNNKEAKNELSKADEAIRNSAMASSGDGGKVADQPANEHGRRVPIRAIQIPEHLRSKKPLQRIKIKEVQDGASPEGSGEVLEMARIERQKTGTSGAGLEKVWTEPVASSEVRTAPAASSEISKDMPKELPPGKDEVEPAPIETPTGTLRPPPKLPSAPTSSYQFQKDYRSLKCHQELLYQYLRAIPCSTYASLFQHSLESDVMSHMLLIFRDHYMWNGDDLYHPLWNLSQTKRFSALKLFLCDDDRRVLRELFDHMKKTKARSEEELLSLEHSYGLC